MRGKATLSLLFLVVMFAANAYGFENTYYVYGGSGSVDFTNCRSPIANGFTYLGRVTSAEASFDGGYATYVLTNFDDVLYDAASAPTYTQAYLDAVKKSDGSYLSKFNSVSILWPSYFFGAPDKKFIKMPSSPSLYSCIIFANSAGANPLVLYAAAQTDPIPASIALQSATLTAITLAITESPTSSVNSFDVATDSGFSNMLPGYENYYNGNASTFTASGLQPGTAYYFRTRSGEETISYNSGTLKASTETFNTYYVYGTPSSEPCVGTAWMNNATYLGDGIHDKTFNGSYSYYVVTNFTDGNIDACRNDVPVFLDAMQWSTGDYLEQSDVVSSANTDTILRTPIIGPPDGNLLEIGIRYGTSGSCGCILLQNPQNASSLRVIPYAGSSPLPPDAPVAYDAIDVTATTFRAVWSPVDTAASYLLTIGLDADFTTLLDGYNQRDIGFNTFAIVEGLSPKTDYYYKVYTVNTQGTSQASNTIKVTTRQGVSGMLLPSANMILLVPQE